MPLKPTKPNSFSIIDWIFVSLRRDTQMPFPFSATTKDATFQDMLPISVVPPRCCAIVATRSDRVRIAYNRMTIRLCASRDGERIAVQLALENVANRLAHVDARLNYHDDNATSQSNSSPRPNINMATFLKDRYVAGINELQSWLEAGHQVA